LGYPHNGREFGKGGTKERIDMKKILLATAMSVAVFGSAKAGFQAPPDIGSSVSLVCRPPLDRTDRDPVVKTFVTLSFKNGYEVQEFTVIHELFNGRKIDRSDQYTGTVAHVPGQNEWSWTGRLDRNRSITMEARVFRNARNEWWYEESVFHDGRSDVSIRYRCSENEGGD
jgi:hypothetical protein